MSIRARNHLCIPKPYHLVKVVWLILNVAFLLVSAGLLARLVRLPVIKVAIPIALLTLLVPPVYGTLLLGQINFLLLLTASLYLSSSPSSNRPKDILGGILLGIAAAIKLYPAFLGSAYLFRRRFVCLTSMIVTMLAVFFFGILAGGGLENTARFFSEVLPSISALLLVLHRYWRWLTSFLLPSPLLLAQGFFATLLIWLISLQVFWPAVKDKSDDENRY